MLLLEEGLTPSNQCIPIGTRRPVRPYLDVATFAPPADRDDDAAAPVARRALRDDRRGVGPRHGVTQLHAQRLVGAAHEPVGLRERHRVRASSRTPGRRGQRRNRNAQPNAPLYRQAERVSVIRLRDVAPPVRENNASPCVPPPASASVRLACVPRIVTVARPPASGCQNNAS